MNFSLSKIQSGQKRAENQFTNQVNGNVIIMYTIFLSVVKKIIIIKKCVSIYVDFLIVEVFPSRLITFVVKQRSEKSNYIFSKRRGTPVFFHFKKIYKKISMLKCIIVFKLTFMQLYFLVFKTE